MAGVLLAFSTRRVSGRFNESKSIGRVTPHTRETSRNWPQCIPRLVCVSPPAGLHVSLCSLLSPFPAPCSALVIYNIVFAIGIIIPILLLIDAVGDVQTILLLFCMSEIGFATLAVLFIPKLLQYKASQQEAVSEASKSSSGNDSYTFIPLDNLSSAAQLGAYINALQRHMDEARKAMHKYKIAAVGSTTTLTPTASGLNASNLHIEPRLSVSTTTAAAVAALEAAAPSSSPSIRISSRVQPQPNFDSAHSWRLSESRRTAWTPPRSSRSGPAGNTPHNEQQPQQQQPQQQQQVDEQELASGGTEGVASAHGQGQYSNGLLSPQPQPYEENRAPRAGSITAAGAASIIAVAAATNDEVCAEE